MKMVWMAKSVSVLVGAMLLVLALFSSSPIAHILLAVIGVVWIGAVVAYGVYRMLRQNPQKVKKVLEKYAPSNAEAKPDTKESSPVQEYIMPDENEAAIFVMLRHASYRITDFLRSAYPDAIWNWETQHPEQVIANGGTVRIKTAHTGDFTHADVLVDKNANIRINLLRMATLEQLLHGVSQSAESVAPSNIEAWYSLMGKKKLEEIQVDLLTRGHQALFIAENGDVLVIGSAGKVKETELSGLPGKTHWGELVALLTKDGKKVQEEENLIKLSFA